jgi:hypothetical protein
MKHVNEAEIRDALALLSTPEWYLRAVMPAPVRPDVRLRPRDADEAVAFAQRHNEVRNCWVNINPAIRPGGNPATGQGPLWAELPGTVRWKNLKALASQKNFRRVHLTEVSTFTLARAVVWEEA